MLLFFFNDTATTEIYTLSLHDALPIFPRAFAHPFCSPPSAIRHHCSREHEDRKYGLFALVLFLSTGNSVGISLDRKSTRLNSSHANISYAVFCLKKKKKAYYLNFLPSY